MEGSVGMEGSMDFSEENLHRAYRLHINLNIISLPKDLETGGASDAPWKNLEGVPKRLWNIRKRHKLQKLWQEWLKNPRIKYTSRLEDAINTHNEEVKALGEFIKKTSKGPSQLWEKAKIFAEHEWNRLRDKKKRIQDACTKLERINNAKIAQIAISDFLAKSNTASDSDIELLDGDELGDEALDCEDLELLLEGFAEVEQSLVSS